YDGQRALILGRRESYGSILYPDVIAMVEEIFHNHPKTDSIILLSEIEVLLKDVLIPVSVFAFDLMYLDGQVYPPFYF
ncbi:hypothetical protein MPER_07965, partial [Moniliophthora perniciosa FA553]